MPIFDRYGRREEEEAQDIRRYEMSSQVRHASPTTYLVFAYLYIRTYNNLEDLATTSSFWKALTLQVFPPEQAVETQGSRKMRRTMICMLEASWSSYFLSVPYVFVVIR
jgi:hypothetical protein